MHAVVWCVLPVWRVARSSAAGVARAAAGGAARLSVEAAGGVERRAARLGRAGEEPCPDEAEHCSATAACNFGRRATVRRATVPPNLHEIEFRNRSFDLPKTVRLK